MWPHLVSGTEAGGGVVIPANLREHAGRDLHRSSGQNHPLVDPLPPLGRCGHAASPRTVEPMIEITKLTKQYGAHTAVTDVTCTVRPGVVTGLLGPNGAGKSTTLRMLVGLTRPTAGVATILGRRYVDLPAPAATVGVLLDSVGFTQDGPGSRR